MANNQINILEHWSIVKVAGRKAYEAVHVAQLLADNYALSHIRLYAEDYDRLCHAIKMHGYRSDGFRIGKIKAVRFDERK
jgi:hypothetical protein